MYESASWLLSLIKQVIKYCCCWLARVCWKLQFPAVLLNYLGLKKFFLFFFFCILVMYLFKVDIGLLCSFSGL